jgi:mannosyltransferase
VSDSVEFPGRLDADGVEAELHRATVCVFPSRWETFGNAVAEAAALGRPIVASAIPPFRELVTDGVTGSLVPMDDPLAWATAIVRVLSDHDRACIMGQAGAALVSRLSDPGRVADLTLAAYADALARHSTRRRAGAGTYVA